MMLFYSILTRVLSPCFSLLLSLRAKKGKEEKERLGERKGRYKIPRPRGKLIWLHAASVGESQSALILISSLLKNNEGINILVTTGTVTSAELMAQKLPKGAFHQYYPLDNPAWVKRFLKHWQPDFVLWMESELWPNMLREVNAQKIPAALLNARLSDKSYKNWSRMKRFAMRLLQTFTLILTQTTRDEERFKKLGADNVHTTDNIKFSAAPLPADEDKLNALKDSIQGRPCWVFASTHKGEEEMACRIHDILKNSIPDLLTIIVPRHPDRREDILVSCKDYNLNMMLRTSAYNPPVAETDLYIADTLGELGLFYRLAPIACIGRSFSDDGGGGHNPIEAAQLGCVVLYGPNVQYQQDIYDEMQDKGAALLMSDEHRMADTLHKFLMDEERLHEQQELGLNYANNKSAVIERVYKYLRPLLKSHDIVS